jgi:hypothetical protein
MPDHLTRVAREYDTNLKGGAVEYLLREVIICPEMHQTPSALCLCGHGHTV